MSCRRSLVPPCVNPAFITESAALICTAMEGSTVKEEDSYRIVVQLSTP